MHGHVTYEEDCLTEQPRPTVHGAFGKAMTDWGENTGS